MARQSVSLASVLRLVAVPTIILIIATVGMLVLGTARSAHSEARGSAANAAGPGEAPTPVLVELFTSEGCSSCPPADALLEKLDRLQPVDHAELIVLSEHVDYWNDIGWKDPYSAHEYSERQNAYAERFAHGSVYTPQMVVDGHIEFVGSDEERALHAIEDAAKVRKVPVRISSVSLNGDNKLAFHLEAGPLSASSDVKPAAVLLAIADDSDVSHVSGGENDGRVLKHVAVLRTLVPIGSVNKIAEFSRDISVSIVGNHQANLRIVVIVQEPDAGKVWGLASARLSN